MNVNVYTVLSVPLVLCLQGCLFGLLSGGETTDRGPDSPPNDVGRVDRHTLRLRHAADPQAREQLEALITQKFGHDAGVVDGRSVRVYAMPDRRVELRDSGLPGHMELVVTPAE